MVVGEANNGLELLELLSSLKADVVLLDLKMPIINGIQATKKLKEKYPNIRVLILTTYTEDAWLFDAIRNGADGYILKDTSRESLIQSIEECAGGLTPIDPQVAGRLFSKLSQTSIQSDSTLKDVLTEREKGILKLISHGMTNAEIARNLFLSEGTIRNYVSNILEKLEVNDRTKAAVIAIRFGLVD
jgi:DNA-binding NarL/FixJ family response regulator